MQGIKVDSNYMYIQGRQTIQSAADFQSEINALKTTVNALMDVWVGTAATAFNTSADTQINNLTEFKEVLALLGEKICEGAKRLDQAEEMNADEARNIF